MSIGCERGQRRVMQTPNLHLNLFTPLGVGWREDATAGLLIDENMSLLDEAYSGAGAGATAIAVETTRAETAEALLAPTANPVFTGSATLENFSSATSASQAWGYSSKITISASEVAGAGLLNFPVLIAGTYVQLATVANGGNVQNANGYDVVFSLTPYYSGSILNHEIVSWNGTNGAVIYNVQVPALSSSVNTVIYVLYGNSAITSSQANPTAVYDAGFKTVAHMNQASGATLLDSTSTGNNSTVNTGTSVAGLWGLATQFIAEYASFPAQWSANTPWTFSGWMKVPNATNYGMFLQARTTTGADPGATLYAAITNGLATQNITGTGGGRSSAGANIADGAWHYLALSYDGTGNLLFVVDGVTTTALTAITAMPTWPTTWQVGNNSALAYGQTTIQEFRASNILRSTVWLLTEYNNQSSPSTFYTVGAATAVTLVTNQPSPVLEVAGAEYSGSTSTTDFWALQDVLGNGANPTSTLAFTHSGSTGPAMVSVPSLLVGGVNAGPNGGVQNEFFPESYGAHCDGAHDDTAAIQAAINAASANGGGTVVLGVGFYLVSSPLVISSSYVNIRGVSSGNTATYFPVNTVQSSVIISNSITADVLQLTGTALLPLTLNLLQDFTITRSVQPTGTAAGVRYTYNLWTYTVRVWSINHMQCFSTTNTVGNMRLDNCLAYNQSTSNPPGASGFFGPFKNSCVLMNCCVGYCAYGMNFNGGYNDVSVYGMNTAGCGYGIYITGTGGDIQFVNCIHDAIQNSAYYISGCQGSVQIIGGYVSGGTYGLEIENSSSISCTAMQFGAGTATGTQVYINGSTSQGNVIANNIFLMASPGIGIKLNACSNNSIIGNSLKCPATGITLLGSSNNVVEGNTIYGASGAVVTTGISFDSSSNSNSGVNSIGPAYVTTPISDSGTSNGLFAATQSPLDNSTKVATTAYTDLAVGVETARAEVAEALLAPLASPTFTGTVSVPNLSILGSLTGPYSIALTAQPGSISATNLVATPVTTALYEISYYLNDTTAGTSGTVSLTITWNDGASQTFTSSSVTFGTTGAFISGAIVVKATSGAIQYATTVTSAIGSPAYSLDLRVKQLV